MSRGTQTTKAEQGHQTAPIRADKIVRFTGAERALHWAIALPFMVCLTTAAVLFFYYNPDPMRPHRAVFSWIHRASGICLIVAPTLVFIVCWRSWRLFLQNMKEGWLWTFAEVKWLFLMPLSVISKKISLPEERKFNAAEKLNFMMVTVACPLLAVTGLAIWLMKFPFYPWMIHIGLTALVLPLVLGHKFMAVVNPGTRVGLSGMFSGRVDRAWAKHHYRRWYRENFEQFQPETVAAVEPADEPLFESVEPTVEPYASVVTAVEPDESVVTAVQPDDSVVTTVQPDEPQFESVVSTVEVAATRADSPAALASVPMRPAAAAAPFGGERSGAAAQRLHAVRTPAPPAVPAPAPDRADGAKPMSYGQALQELALERQRAGQETEAARLAQEAVGVCIATGDLARAAVIFCTMGRDNRLRLSRADLLTIAAELRRRRNLTWATHVYGVLIRQDAEDELAVEGLLRTAADQRTDGNSPAAMKVYAFLMRHAPSFEESVRQQMDKAALAA